MSEQEEVVAELGEAGVLDGVRWAYLSASDRTLSFYSEADGHDAAWLGNTRFTYFRDRLDRVFACGRYEVKPGSDGIDLDALREQLSARDVATMPRIATDLVRRSDLNGSPGWAYGERRFLLASCTYGKMENHPWPQKSRTKQNVARQCNPTPDPSLFDEHPDEEIGGLEAMLSTRYGLDMVTFVVGHSLDPLSQRVELVFGRARMNTGGGPAWYWRQHLLTAPPSPGGHRTDDMPLMPSGPSTAPDAEVRVRPQAERGRDRGSGKA